MRIEQLYQFIVPLTFLAIWALTSLFNREAQPLPPRAGRPPGPPGPPGPRPESGFSPTSASDWRTELVERQSTPVRPGLSGPGLRGGPRADARSDDDILIIEAEPRRQITVPATRIGPPAARRTVRVKTAPKEASRRGQSGPAQVLSQSSQVYDPMDKVSDEFRSQALHDELTRISKEIRAKALSPLLQPSSPTPASAKDATAPHTDPKTRTAGPSPLTLADVRRGFASPARVRESFLLKEVLESPLALRARRVPPRSPQA
jgi:hypothetical protein